MTTSAQSTIETVIEDIREYHRKGRGSLHNHAGRAAEELIKEDADTSGLDVRSVRHARQFASVYTDNELDELCEQIQTHADAEAPLFGLWHLKKMLAIEKKKRRSLQLKAIKGGWNLKRLGLETAKKFGSRKKGGGKPPQIPGDLNGAYAQLDKMCDSWERWTERLFKLVDEPKKKNPLANMDTDIRTWLESATKSIVKLRAASRLNWKTNVLGDHWPSKAPKLRRPGKTDSGQLSAPDGALVLEVIHGRTVPLFAIHDMPRVTVLVH